MGTSAPALDVRYPKADCGSGKIGSAPARGKKGPLEAAPTPKTIFFILSSEKVNY